MRKSEIERIKKFTPCRQKGFAWEQIFVFEQSQFEKIRQNRK